jgi:hypothetical protein
MGAPIDITPKSVKPLIVLDADGVLLDYHEGYARAWEQAFGHRPALRNPQAYHAMDYWDVPRLDAAERAHLASRGFTRNIWRDMPAIEGAVAACRQLQEAGFELACVTALDPEFEADRAENLKALGFELSSVHAVGSVLGKNPKSRRVAALAPVAFVDDFLPYLQNLPSSTWRALIQGRPHLNPNHDAGLSPPDSRHEHLADFASFWIERTRRMHS